MATVLYHATTREVRFEETPEGEQAPFSAFTPVACVLSDSPEEVYRLSQHACNSWLTGEQVMPIALDKMDRTRSTSVGDILHMADGRFLQVARFGFKPVEFDYNA